VSADEILTVDDVHRELINPYAGDALRYPDCDGADE